MGSGRQEEIEAGAGGRRGQAGGTLLVQWSPSSDMS